MSARSESIIKAACDQLVISLGWNWQEPRLVDWLKRVNLYYKDFLWVPGEPVPEFVLVSLAKFLDLRLKYTQLLQILGLTWNDPIVQKIETNYFSKDGRLPLAAYRELHEVLNEKWQSEEIVF